jgi:hypothetical protein
MGVYGITIGKGVIIPVKFFIEIFKKEIEELLVGPKDRYDAHDYFDEIVKKHIHEDYKICILGHDAFDGRNGTMLDMFYSDPSDNAESAEMIEELIQDATHFNDPFDCLYADNLMFIGRFEDIKGPEFNWYVNAPEIIYGIAALLPSLMKLYPKYQEFSCHALAEWCEQKPCIWTFTCDCCCCG